MKFFINIYKSPLHAAIENENADIVKLLVNYNRTDVNISYIL